ncbi:four helix bundle protein [Flavobacterium sp. CFBP9031]|jgi:four helix bundle protein|uniref:four helix bundle protein n=1 Tax=unclassified Flavobacterium TaxID=196869 RepID=UPI002A6A8B2B|nr:four helix bundle protein [Flavobacterium sp. CFBP9031]MDY0987633.1 four helix bundle protein [Flavobacterium sp. CFBP9031]
MKNNIVRNKSFDFAVRIVKLYQYLNNDKKEFILAKQLLRSGTSVGAMIREAEHAESKSDFIHKFAIAQKEANETVYWLELLKATDYLNEKEFQNISNDAIAILKLITSILKTSKSQLNIKKLTTNN